MRILPIAIGLALSTLASTAPAMDFQRGQDLFEQKCQACHVGHSLADKQDKVKSRAELRRRINSWAAHSGTEWGSGEINDVLFYMDKSFYHFDGGKP